MSRNNSELISILGRALGTYYLRDTKRGLNVVTKCPFCHHPKKKLETNITNGAWHCWVCHAKGGSVVSLLKRAHVNPILISEASLIQPRSRNTQQIDQSSNTTITLPKGSISLASPAGSLHKQLALSYLIQHRKLTLSDIIKYDIHYYSGPGQYDNMIIIPNYTATGNLNYFTTRAYTKAANNFINPPYSRDVVGFELQLSTQAPLIMVESAMNAITASLNATPLYGSIINDSLLDFIYENDIEDIVVALDPDAISTAVNYINRFKSAGKRVYFIKTPPNQDINSMGREWFFDQLDKIKPVSEYDSLLMQMQARLI